MSIEYKTNRHSCYSLKYHLVVTTKYQHKCITNEMLKRIEEITKNCLEEKWKCNIIQFNGELDHVHILFEAPPQVQLSKLINNFKTVSSRLIRKEFNNYITKYYSQPYFWSNSYLILSSGGAPIEIIKKYIKEQSTPLE